MKNIIFDKSVLQALSLNEIEQLSSYLKIVVVPPLMREIQTNLIKEDGENKVRSLSRKLQRSDAIYQYGIESIVDAELLGTIVPRDGKPLLFANQVEQRNGKLVIKEPEPSIKISKWATGVYEPNDFNFAQSLKSYHESVDLNRNKARWTKEMRPPKFKDLQECSNWLENALNNANQQNLLLFLVDEVVKSDKKTVILQRWRDGKFDRLRDFCWSGYWNLSIFFFLCFGVSSDLIPSSKKAKAFLDIEYITYLPYSHGIASGDNIFKGFYDIFSRQNQVFISLVEIRSRLVEIEEGKRETFFNKGE